MRFREVRTPHTLRGRVQGPLCLTKPLCYVVRIILRKDWRYKNAGCFHLPWWINLLSTLLHSAPRPGFRLSSANEGHRPLCQRERKKSELEILVSLSFCIARGWLCALNRSHYCSWPFPLSCPSVAPTARSIAPSLPLCIPEDLHFLLRSLVVYSGLFILLVLNLYYTHILGSVTCVSHDWCVWVTVYKRKKKKSTGGGYIPAFRERVYFL